MNTNDAGLSELQDGEGMGDFMRFTTDAPGHALDSAAGADAFTRWPADEPAIRRLSRIGIFRRVAGHGVLRLL